MFRMQLGLSDERQAEHKDHVVSSYEESRKNQEEAKQLAASLHRYLKWEYKMAHMIATSLANVAGPLMRTQYS